MIMKSTNRPFRSNFYLWNGVSAIFFSNCITNIHSHNTLQIVIDLHDRFRCRIGDNPWLTARNLIIRQNALHQLDTNNSVQLIIYLDAETTAAKNISTRHLQDKDAAEPEFHLFDNVNPNDLQQALLKPNPMTLREIIGNILRVLAGETAPPRSDLRIRLIEKIIDTGQPDELNITALAARVHLSESRFRSLFRQQTGVSVYKYILWSRIRYAIGRVMAGHPINDAAWSAGFTDNSHFHKILVNMFGISPSQFLRDHKTMDILTCDQSPLNFVTIVYDVTGHPEKVY